MDDQTKKSARLLSLDAFRGFDMLFIIGIDAIVWASMAYFQCPGNEHGQWWLSRQFSHPRWFGLTFYDLIFPTFLFIAGISFPFSYAKQVEKGMSKLAIHLKILKRAAILMFLGVVTNGLFACRFETLGYGSVLGKIGEAWAIAAICYVNFGRKTRLGICLGLILAYAAMLLFLVAPDAPAGCGSLTLEGCFIGWLDRLWMPGKLYLGDKLAPSGVNVNFFASATAMLGMFAGEIVRSGKWTGNRKTVNLLAMAAGLFAAAMVMKIWIPFSKMLWCPTFILGVGAYSTAMFALFYWLIDVKGFRGWTKFFTVIGVNSITIYMLQQIVNFGGVSEFFLKGAVARWFTGAGGFFSAATGGVLIALGALAAKWLLLWFLDRKKIYLKV